MEPILEAKKLNLWYGPNHALHDVSIAIPEHEITAFIGPSGCGKSTFLRTLNRMNDLIPECEAQRRGGFPRTGPLRQLCGPHMAPQADRHGVSEGQPIPYEHLR